MEENFWDYIQFWYKENNTLEISLEISILREIGEYTLEISLFRFHFSNLWLCTAGYLTITFEKQSSNSLQAAMMKSITASFKYPQQRIVGNKRFVCISELHCVTALHRVFANNDLLHTRPATNPCYGNCVRVDSWENNILKCPAYCYSAFWTLRSLVILYQLYMNYIAAVPRLVKERQRFHLLLQYSRFV